jgi:lysophospholipase L1-like esterase
MKRAAFALIAALALAGLASAGAARAGHSPTAYYISLGDSLAASTQPTGDFQHGYAEQLYAELREQDSGLKLVKLGCGGESTTSMLYGSQDPAVAKSCGPPIFYLRTYPHKTQLAEAIAFLKAHRQSVSLVTIDIGANDLPNLSAIATNLPIILDRLRTAAGPSIPIVGMNYYDPNLATIWLGGGSLSDLNAEIGSVVAFNDFLEGLYEADPADGAAPYADVESAFRVTNTTLVNGTPLDVILECQWTWICFPPPLGPDVHANTAGYGVIAQAFLDALP